MDFLDWNVLGSFAGASFAVALLTQVTKNVPGIAKLPTQLWSYIVALATLLLAQFFTAGFSASGAVMALFNAAMVSLSANGGYQALVKLKGSVFGEGQE